MCKVYLNFCLLWRASQALRTQKPRTLIHGAWLTWLKAKRNVVCARDARGTAFHAEALRSISTIRKPIVHIAHSSAQQTSTVCKVCTLRFAHLGTSAPNAMASRAIILNESNLPSVADSAVQCNQHPRARAGRTSCNASCLAQLRGIPNIFQITSLAQWPCATQEQQKHKLLCRFL